MLTDIGLSDLGLGLGSVACGATQGMGASVEGINGQVEKKEN